MSRKLRKKRKEKKGMLMGKGRKTVFRHNFSYRGGSLSECMYASQPNYL